MQKVGMQTGLRLFQLLIGLILLMMAGMTQVDSIDNALGLVTGGGMHGSHLSDRSYMGVIYDWRLSPNWQVKIPWGLMCTQNSICHAGVVAPDRSVGM